MFRGVDLHRHHLVEEGPRHHPVEEDLRHRHPDEGDLHHLLMAIEADPLHRRLREAGLLLLLPVHTRDDLRWTDREDRHWNDWVKVLVGDLRWNNSGNVLLWNSRDHHLLCVDNLQILVMEEEREEEGWRCEDSLLSPS